MTQPIRPVARLGLVVSAATALALVGTGSAQAGPAACDNRVNNTHAKLAECVTLAGVQEHLAAFQSIADANGGNRASGTTGFDASRDYVVSKLKAAGYSPQVQ
ncbi:MAG TPA: aminopeptidase, partial [Phycicoccus sp.]|nr:aminopeptidase [Phycicoccus sp.]